MIPFVYASGHLINFFFSSFFLNYGRCHVTTRPVVVIRQAGIRSFVASVQVRTHFGSSGGRSWEVASPDEVGMEALDAPVPGETSVLAGCFRLATTRSSATKAPWPAPAPSSAPAPQRPSFPSRYRLKQPRGCAPALVHHHQHHLDDCITRQLHVWPLPKHQQHLPSEGRQPEYERQTAVNSSSRATTGVRCSRPPLVNGRTDRQQ
jgi:hypothetical protein